MTNEMNLKTMKDINEYKIQYQNLVEKVAKEIMGTSENYGEALDKCNQLDYETKWRGLTDDVELVITENMYATQINE